MKREYVRRLLSAYLVDTSEEKRFKIDVSIYEQGTSELERIHLVEAWQHPTEGIIVFKTDGGEEIEFDDLDDDTLKDVVSFFKNETDLEVEVVDYPTQDELNVKYCPYCGSENVEWMGDEFGEGNTPFHCHQCDKWFGVNVKY